ncbi:hypothetical protein LPJ61_002794 [Coemansia biformis]|uniref:histone acetyltransferase n=1 Tax=Coemansia biformis TaxID=1286918 RepID=A0A9W7Y7N9_9FUNG|nr:hypothetical protein LPJ61_002794 [Coemansia biformis]
MAVDACIEKLDTSGELGARMPLARMLVAGYLCSLQKYHNALDIPAVGVHLFARAQHEYLFAKSRDNPGKHALDDLALVRWWKRTLDHALAYATSTMSSSLRHAAAGPDGCVTDGPHVRQPESTVAYCVVPGADASEAPALIGPQHDTGSGDAPAVDWRWGLPHPAESRAHDCVLQFPDDPVTRLLAEPHSKNWSVAMLLEMLSVSEECGAGHRTAYFSASLPVALATGHPASAQVGGSPRADQPTQASESAGQGTLTPEDYDNTLLALFDRDMDFSCSDSAARSSKRLAAYLTATFAIPSVTIATNGPATAHWPPAPRASAPPPVNDLTAAIRKRRKVDQ